jgi:hypothetical protein
LGERERGRPDELDGLLLERYIEAFQMPLDARQRFVFPVDGEGRVGRPRQWDPRLGCEEAEKLGRRGHSEGTATGKATLLVTVQDCVGFEGSLDIGGDIDRVGFAPDVNLRVIARRPKHHRWALAERHTEIEVDVGGVPGQVSYLLTEEGEWHLRPEQIPPDLRVVNVPKQISLETMFAAEIGAAESPLAEVDGRRGVPDVESGEDRFLDVQSP